MQKAINRLYNSDEYSLYEEMVNSILLHSEEVLDINYDYYLTDNYVAILKLIENKYKMVKYYKLDSMFFLNYDVFLSTFSKIEDLIKFLFNKGKVVLFDKRNNVYLFTLSDCVIFIFKKDDLFNIDVYKNRRLVGSKTIKAE